MLAEPCSQRTLGSDSQGKASSTCVFQSKEERNPGNFRMKSHPKHVHLSLTLIEGIEPRNRPLDV